MSEPNKTKPSTQNKQAYEFKQIKSSFFEFAEVGDTIECTVLGDCSYYSDGQTVPCLLVITTDGERRKLNLGTHQLRELYAIEEPSKGDFLVIRYDGEDEEIKRKGNKMKIFSYFIEKNNPTP